MKKVNTTILGFILVAIIVVVAIGTSYSYMTDLSGNVQMDVINLKEGKLVSAYQGNTPTFKSSDYEKSSELIGSKTFSVTGTNNSSENILKYNLSLVVNYNEYEDNEVYFILSGKTDDNGALTDKADVKQKHYLSKQSGESTIDLGNGFFSTNASENVHTYVIYYYTTNVKANKNFETKVAFRSAE